MPRSRTVTGSRFAELVHSSNGSTPLREIHLPKTNRPESRFAHEVGSYIGPLNVLFRYQGNIVEIKEDPFPEDQEVDKRGLAIGGLKFVALSACRARTWLEQYITTGYDVPLKDDKGKPTGIFRFSPLTMKQQVASSLLVSPQFEKHIPLIHRILDVPIPIRLASGKVITPDPGFNRKLGIYCDPSCPKIVLMEIEEAKIVLEEALVGFCWKGFDPNKNPNPQSKRHAIARMLTPFARGLMGFWARPPLWYFTANRPRAGKDYLAGVTQIIYEGHAFEDAALGENAEETRKRITRACVSGRRMFHFANCQGYIQSAPFIQAITAPVWCDRDLGATKAENDLHISNEIDYSISCNVGTTYREDIGPRLKKIELEFFDENENGRTFPNVYLHSWLKENRGKVLSAIASIFKFWIDKGMPPGKTPFTSFPEWAAVIGGVMQTYGLGDPCLPHEDDDAIGGDRRTVAMKALYELCYNPQADKNHWLTKQNVFEIITTNQPNDDRLEWFGDLTGQNKQALTTKAGIAFRSEWR